MRRRRADDERRSTDKEPLTPTDNDLEPCFHETPSSTRKTTTAPDVEQEPPISILICFLWRLPSSLCFAFLFYGIYLNHTLLYTHDECDMTWSQREFVPIPLLSSTSIAKYRLFKFVDRRDPRNLQLLDENHASNRSSSSSSSSSSWCFSPPNTAATTTAVLYVPGHGGSYQQARSLGAHGIQMTRKQLSKQQIAQKQHSLMSIDWAGNSTELDKFVYDVFAVDFDEEPTGLHGAFVQSQASFLVQATHHLIDSCQFEQIAIVAHSMGGYAAELARLLDPTIQPYIRNMITLGTPHAHPSLAWEQSLYEIRDRVQRESNDYDFGVISISGGLGDAIIPPRACDASFSHAASATLLATEFMTKAIDSENKRPPTFGMDHQAIVWCHNLLDSIRSILHQLVVENGLLTSVERVQQVRNRRKGITKDYLESVTQQQDRLWTMFGWKALFMDAALTYHVIWLAGFYCFIAIGHCVFRPLAIPSNVVRDFITWILLPLSASLQGVLQTESNVLSTATALILAFTANGIFHLAYLLLGRYIQARWAASHRESMTLIAVVLTLTVFVVALVSASFSKLDLILHRIVLHRWLALSSIAIIYTMSFLQIGMLPRQGTTTQFPLSFARYRDMLSTWRSPSHQLMAMRYRRTVIVAWLFPVLPLLLAGDVAVIWLEGEVSPRIFLVLVAPIICWLLMCFILDGLPRSYGKGRLGQLTLLLRLLTISQNGAKLFRLEHPQYDTGFASATTDLIVQMVQLEILELIAAWFMGRYGDPTGTGKG